jgi:diaminopimelate epimerase
MGNTHCIIFVNDLENDINFNIDGPTLESAITLFPKKCNIEFVQVIKDYHLIMKVRERGTGPTFACGTVTSALVVAAIRAGQINNDGVTPVRVTLPSVDLYIAWNPTSDNKV